LTFRRLLPATIAPILSPVADVLAPVEPILGAITTRGLPFALSDGVRCVMLRGGEAEGRRTKENGCRTHGTCTHLARGHFKQPFHPFAP
jgi:hypothetical protein